MDLSVRSPSSSPSNHENRVDHSSTTTLPSPPSGIKGYFRMCSVWLLLLGMILGFFAIIFSHNTNNFLQAPKILEEVFSIWGFHPAMVPKDAFLDCPPPPNIPRDAEPTCRWKFVHYEPSFYEQIWHDNINEWSINICARVASESHLRASREIIRQIQALKKAYPNTTWSTVDSMPAGELAETYELMSRFHYERECFDPVPREWKSAGKGVQLIEPLWGWLRDPFDTYCNLTYGKLPGWDGDIDQSKEHIMPLGFAPYAYTLEDGDIPEDQWRTHGIPPWKRGAAADEVPFPYSPYGAPRRIAIDMSSSYYNSSSRSKRITDESSKWFYENYYKKGIKFDKFIQFIENQGINKTDRYIQIPEDLLPVYKLINVPVGINPKKNITHIAQIIRTFLRPYDFFTFKLDIDNDLIEESFSFSMLVDDSIASLVDEFYFEHHVDCDTMRVWGYDLPQNMTDSYFLFSGLRKKGMRAHSWS